MDVLEAIKSRKSIRAFTKQSISRETILEILEISQRAPSGTNTQPWHVCTGDIRQAITKDVLALAAENKAAKYEGYDYYPSIWNGIHRARRRDMGWGLYGFLGH